ncbi:hypothetical protein J3R30DRAFT_3430155 [Lentinula aciculospora]|uniref:BTB domain-containing protein n=1 Tax=Lentinula aciculospora TaxID=153920 RepID=A0A9W9AQ99_9AGAR|nr:hypothetical protein J3R30DRAFT_3430155 [Lentinula aciculospora]
MNPEPFESGSVVLWPDSNSFSDFADSFLQIPTLPPHSDTKFVDSDRVSSSTTFSPNTNWHSDLALVSADSVIFYVASRTLLDASDNAFRHLIPTTPSDDTNLVIHVPESSTTLDIMLHTVYNKSFSQYRSFEDLSNAVDQLPVYGVPSKAYIYEDTHLYKMLLSFAPIFPLKVYILAAKHDLEDLAVSTSSHLLSFDLSTLSDETAEAIGSEYLRRLFFLHIGRLDALKRLLLWPPNSHSPTASCDAALTRAWALASAYLAWDSRPDLSTNLLESTFVALYKDLSCNICKENLNTRINDLSTHWSLVKRTI